MASPIPPENRAKRAALTAAYLLTYWASQQRPIPHYTGLIDALMRAASTLS